jgi:hypothetical protein
MKQLSTFLTAFCVTLVAAAAIAQTTEPPATSNASRRQSGTVGPPLDAPSMNQPAASSARSAAPTGAPATPAPAAAPTPVQSPVQSPVQAPEVEPADPTPPATVLPAESAKPAAGSRASRRASGRVTDADGSSGGLPVRPDRN